MGAGRSASCIELVRVHLLPLSIILKQTFKDTSYTLAVLLVGSSAVALVAHVAADVLDYRSSLLFFIVSMVTHDMYIFPTAGLVT